MEVITGPVFLGIIIMSYIVIYLFALISAQSNSIRLEATILNSYLLGFLLHFILAIVFIIVMFIYNIATFDLNILTTISTIAAIVFDVIFMISFYLQSKKVKTYPN